MFCEQFDIEDPMINTIKKLIHAVYLILKGYDPIYFVGRDGYISTGSNTWFASGTKPFPEPKDAIRYLADKSAKSGVIWKKVEYKGAVFYISNTMQIRDQYVGVLEPEFDGKRYYVKARIKSPSGGWSKTNINRSCLVAMAFLGHKKHSNMQIHHKDGNRCNDRPENLQLLTPKEHKALHAEEQGKPAPEKPKAKRGKRGGKRTRKAQESRQGKEAKKPSRKTPISELPVVRERAFGVAMAAKTPFRACLLKTLGDIEERDIVEAGIDYAVKPLRQSFESLGTKKMDPVETFDEMLFALRTIALFAERYPHLNSETIEDLTRTFYGKLKKSVNAIKQGDPLESAALLEIMEEERRNPHYEAIGYTNRFNGLYIEVKKATEQPNTDDFSSC